MAYLSELLFLLGKLLQLRYLLVDIDYCNSPFHNTARKDITTLQCVQNCVAKVVTRYPSFTNSSVSALTFCPISYHL